MNRGMSVEMASEDTTLPQADDVSCNLQKVFEHFSTGLVNSDDVDMDKYLAAYKELFNFFILLGSGFGFIASDVKDKIRILESHKNASAPGQFDTVSKMMNYEMSNDLLEKKGYVSGSRTLLRLHRGLDFVRKFLLGVYGLGNSDSTSQPGRKAYDDSLGNFHSWVIRKAAQLAIKLLPSKKDLLKKITKGDEAAEKATYEVMPNMLKAMDEVYQRVEDLYTKNKLHELS